MKCKKCKQPQFNEMDGEFICESCGAAYCLEYLGYYPEGSNERIDKGFESGEYKKLINNIKVKTFLEKK